jgi:hypothetical protein
MTAEEWKNRCTNRIFRAVKKAGHIRIRDLKRATHYNRGPKDESIPLWYSALDYLGRSKKVVIRRNEDGVEKFVMTPEVAEIMGVVTTQVEPMVSDTYAE